MYRSLSLKHWTLLILETASKRLKDRIIVAQHRRSLSHSCTVASPVSVLPPSPAAAGPPPVLSILYGRGREDPVVGGKVGVSRSEAVNHSNNTLTRVLRLGG
ncbi:hypothetical protein J6590_012255 [Homalodisca vitripennis]|nr:hypothetical protein J6590_012255 [Homalodisca vitripennis]